MDDAPRRILVIDDNPAIHEDFRKILAPGPSTAVALSSSAAALLGDTATPGSPFACELDFASQGQEGLELVRSAQASQRPYALAFIDARMPPGWDGIETAARIWQQDPDVQIVLCTAYSDYSWLEIRTRLVQAAQLVILKKPFEVIEVLQLADALTEKWRLTRHDRRRLQALEQRIRERNEDLEAMQRINAQLNATNERLTTANRSSDSMADPHMRRRHAIAQELGEALRSDELSVHYQPLVDIASRRIVGLEALLRWDSSKLGAVSPAEFIPIAEETGLIVPVGEFVLRAACEQIVRWEKQNIAVVPVAVNLSAVQLEHEPIWEFVSRILRATGMRPERLALELTESTFIQNAQRHADALQRLRSDGVRIQIDDFGTGYSSLSYLRHLPLDGVKIDRSFIAQLATNSTDEAIVSAILAMARGLRLRAIAEGVETSAQLEVLGRHGCELAQGFYFCRPLPADQCRDLLEQASRRSSFTDTLRMRVVSTHRDFVSRVTART